MKKVFFKILMITIIFAIVSGVMYFEAVFEVDGNETIKEITDKYKSINEEVLNGEGEVGDIGGYTILYSSLFSGVTNAAQIFIIIFALVLIPYAGLSAIVFLQILARIFQIGIIKKWKNITSIILTIIALLIQLAVIICYMYIATKVNMNISIKNIILGINILYFVLVIMNLKIKIPSEKDLIEID